MNRKPQLEKEIKRATEIATKLESAEKSVEKSEHQLEAAKRKVHRLKNDPYYKSPDQLASLMEELVEINALSEDSKNHKPTLLTNNNKNDCPICFENAKGKQIYSCQKCHNWICGDCSKKVTGECPLCRQSLTNKPFKRNPTMERHMD